MQQYTQSFRLYSKSKYIIIREQPFNSKKGFLIPIHVYINIDWIPTFSNAMLIQKKSYNNDISTPRKHIYFPSFFFIKIRSLLSKRQLPTKELMTRTTAGHGTTTNSEHVFVGFIFFSLAIKSHLLFYMTV